MDEGKLVSVFFIFFIFLLETLFPFRRDFVYRFRHLFRNATLAVFNGLMTYFLFSVLFAEVFEWIDLNDFGLINCDNLPSMACPVLMFILFDMWMFFWHRINHEIRFLWRFHRVHHNDPQLDISTTFRFHPIEIIISSVLNIIVFMVLGMRLEQYLLYKLVLQPIILFHHSNVNIGREIDRHLRTFIVTPCMHRVHHSKIWKETNSNYGSIFSLWDRLFGTYRRKSPERIIYGLNYLMESKYQTVLGMLIIPFRRKHKGVKINER